ncbi:hypothetical protein RD792_017230 [Penstemon davidsonii]|uniref:At4g15545-like C-terminal domain-containing protein n=1 Tax=Penstemon davidsonii TaxID=160366 RepID=A0ABR0CM19_9LAMI|nr:hypothetical protein RD792_017230 [Penstemon davidsonii]
MFLGDWSVARATEPVAQEQPGRLGDCLGRLGDWPVAQAVLGQLVQSPGRLASRSGCSWATGSVARATDQARLSYEQFSSFLANVKELNSHKQTKEETLRKADEIFGPDNRDLYVVFEGLITRNVQ